MFIVFLVQLWLLPPFTVTALENVARLGTASQSSTHSTTGIASHAIDGNRNSEWSAGSCTHTLEQVNNWWSVLLPGTYRITSVSITNRNVVGHRLNNAQLRIGNFLENNGNFNPSCAVIFIPDGATKSFDCRGMVGRLVSVNLNVLTALTLCEVEVYGKLAVPSPLFSAVVMGRNIAVVEKKLCWSDALFYCRDFHWDLLSIRSEEEQREVEEVLRAASFPLTKHVWLGLRRHLRGGTWMWMSGAPMDYTYWETVSVWQETSTCGGADTSAPFFWRDLPCGDHHYFICSKDYQGDMERVYFYSSTRDYKRIAP